MRQSLYHGAWGALLIALLACGASPPAPESIAAAPEWTLSRVARVSIGVAEGDERYMFSRVNGITRTRTGNFFVTDGGREPALKLFDSTGQFIRRLGRRGNGPGEFEYLTSPFAYRGDSIAVWDLGQRRINVYDSNGELARSMTVSVPPLSGNANASPSQSCCRVANAFPDGSFVLEYPAMIPKDPGPVRHAWVTLASIRFDGTASDSIGSFKDRQYRYDVTARRRTRELHASWPFQYAVVGDTVFGGNGERQWLIRQVPGLPADTIHLTGVSVPVTDSVKAVYAEAYREEFRRDPRYFEGPLSENFEGEYAAFVPAFTQVRSDNAGHVWLAQWRPPFSREPLTFHVYTTSGKPVARIKLPARTWVMHLSRDRVALVEYDADEVQYVRLYDIIRPSR